MRGSTRITLTTHLPLQTRGRRWVNPTVNAPSAVRSVAEDTEAQRVWVPASPGLMVPEPRSLCSLCALHHHMTPPPGELRGPRLRESCGKPERGNASERENRLLPACVALKFSRNIFLLE